MRPEGWEKLLAGHIASAQARDFAWGTHDCVLWCADWVSKITGDDPASAFRGAYSTEQEANQILASLGFADIAQLASAHLPEVPVSRAHRGHIMRHPQGMLGICDGAHAYFLTFQGVLRIPFLRCVGAWKV